MRFLNIQFRLQVLILKLSRMFSAYLSYATSHDFLKPRISSHFSSFPGVSITKNKRYPTSRKTYIMDYGPLEMFLLNLIVRYMHGIEWFRMER